MQIEPGTVIGETECPGCGATLPIKVNKAGGVYFFCARVIGINETTGKAEKCMTRSNFGRTASKKIIDEYLKTQGTEHVKPTENRTEITEHAGNGVEQRGEEPAGPATEEPKRKSGNGFFSSFFD